LVRDDTEHVNTLVGHLLVTCWSLVGHLLVTCWSLVGHCHLLVTCWSLVGHLLVTCCPIYSPCRLMFTYFHVSQHLCTKHVCLFPFVEQPPQPPQPPQPLHIGTGAHSQCAVATGTQLPTSLLVFRQGANGVYFSMFQASSAQPNNPSSYVFIVHVGGTRCVTSSIDNNMKVHACLLLNVEFRQACIFFICLCYV
jgi:hypothetical protein